MDPLRMYFTGIALGLKEVGIKASKVPVVEREWDMHVDALMEESKRKLQKTEDSIVKVDIH